MQVDKLILSDIWQPPSFAEHIAALRERYLRLYSTIPGLWPEEKDSRLPNEFYLQLELVTQREPGHSASTIPTKSTRQSLVLEPWLAEQGSRLVVGKAGAGKTTLLEHIAYRWATGEERELVSQVLLIHLRLLKTKIRLLQGNSPEERLTDFLYRILFDYIVPPTRLSAASYVFQAQKDAPILFLLDGADEILASCEAIDPSNQAEREVASAIKEIVDLLLKQPNVIITSRPAYIQKLGFEDNYVELIGYSDEQVRIEVRKLVTRAQPHLAIDAQEGEVTRIIENLRKNTILWELIHSPMMLRLAWIAIASGETNINTMTDLYSAFEKLASKRHQVKFPLPEKQPSRAFSRMSKSEKAAWDREEEQRIQEYWSPLQKALEEFAYYAIRSNAFFISNETIASKRDELEAKFPGRIWEDELILLDFLQGIGSEPDEFTRDREFFHSSLQEYFAARYILRAVVAGQSSIAVTPNDIVKNELVVEFLQDMVRPDVTIQEKLLRHVEVSKANESQGTVAANAMTLLNATRISFSGMDLSKVRIAGAVLSNAICHRTNFSEADLRRVNLERAKLMDCNFEGTLMEGVIFGEHPDLEHAGKSDSIAVSADGHRIVSGCRDGTIRIWERESGQCLNVLAGLVPVRIIAISPDCSKIISSGVDNELCLWDVETGQCTEILDGHTGLVNSIVLSKNGRWAISGGIDNTIRVWDIAQRQCIRTLQRDEIGDVRLLLLKDLVIKRDYGNALNIEERYTHMPPPNFHMGIAITQDCRMIFCGGMYAQDHAIRIWNRESGQCVQILAGHKAPVTDIILSSDEHCIISASCAVLTGGGNGDNTIRIWERESGRCLRVLKGHGYGITHVSLSKNEDIIFSAESMGNGECTICLWDSANGRCLQMLKGHTGFITKVMLTEDENFIISGSTDKTIRVWDRTTGKCLHILKWDVDQTGIGSIVITTDGSIIVSASDNDNTIQIWDRVSGCRIKVLEGHTEGINGLVLSRDGNLIISVSKDATVRIWEVESGRFVRTLHGHTQPIYQLLLLPNGRLMTTAGYDDNTMRIWDIASGECLEVLQQYKGYRPILSKDGRFILYQGTDCNIQIRESEHGRHLQTLGGRTKVITCLAISKDGTLIAAGNVDRKIQIWDVARRQCLQTLEGHLDKISNVIFSMDGAWVISGSDDCSVRIWERKSGRCLHVLEQHAKPITSIAISQDARVLVSAAKDHTVYVWDCTTGCCLQMLVGHTDEVSSVVYLQDSSLVASASLDSTIRLWERDSGSCLQTLECHAGITSMNISADERWMATAYDYPYVAIRLWDRASGQCVRTIEGHRGDIRSVALSRDGQRLISASADRDIRIWDFASRQCLQTITDDSAISEVIISADDRLIISASDNIIKIWDIASGNCMRTLIGHQGDINSIAISTDSAFIVSGSDDNTVRVWSRESGQCLHTLCGHTEPVESAALSSDGRVIVSGSEDATIRVWDCISGQCLQTIDGHTGTVVSVKFSPDDRLIVSGSMDKTIRIWERDTGRCVRTLTEHTDEVTFVLSLDGALIISWSHNHIKIWAWESGSYLQTLEEGDRDHNIQSVCLSPDGRILISGSTDNTIRILDRDSGQCLHRIVGPSGRVNSLEFSSDNTQILSDDNGSFRLERGRTICVWDVASGARLHSILQAEQRSREASKAIFSPDGRMIIGSADNAIHLWDKDSGQCLHTLENDVSVVTSIALSKDGLWLVSGSDDAVIRIWDHATRQCLRTMHGHTEAVSSIALSTACNLIVSSSKDSTVKMWAWQSGECLRTLTGHLGSVCQVALSLDDRLIFSGGEDHTIRVWQRTDGSCLQIFLGHTSSIADITFSANGRMMISVGIDQDIRIWDFVDFKCLHALQWHPGIISSVTLSRDGHCLISASTDRAIRILDIESGHCIRTLAGHTEPVAGIFLSPDEQLIVSASFDGTLCIWDRESGNCLQNMYLPFGSNLRFIGSNIGALWSVAFSPGGRITFSNIFGSELFYWSRDVEPHPIPSYFFSDWKPCINWINCVTLSPDGTKIISGSGDNTVHIWDFMTDKYLQTLYGHTGSIYAVTCSPDGRLIVSGSEDKTIKIWDIADGHCLQTLRGHDAPVNSITITPDGIQMISGSCDAICIWDFVSGKRLRAISGSFRTVTLSPDGNMIISSSSDESIHIWERTSTQGLRNLDEHVGEITNLLFSRDGKLIVSASDCTMRIWERASRRCLQTLRGHKNTISSIALSSDGSMLLSTGDFEYVFRIWDVNTGKCLQTISAEGHTDRMNSVMFSSDGSFFISGNGDGTIRIWERISERCVGILKGQTAKVMRVVLSRDDKLIVSASDDGTIRIWERENGRWQLLDGHGESAEMLASKPIRSGVRNNRVSAENILENGRWRPVDGYSESAEILALSPDGQLIASGGYSDNHAIRVWDIASRHCLQTLAGHMGGSTSLIFSHDGKRIISGGDRSDHTIRIWDIASGQCLQILEGHIGRVSSLILSPDDNTLISGGADEIIKYWQSIVGQWVLTGEICATETPLTCTRANITAVRGLSERNQRLLQQRGAVTRMGIEADVPENTHVTPKINQQYPAPHLRASRSPLTLEPTKETSAVKVSVQLGWNCFDVAVDLSNALDIRHHDPEQKAIAARQELVRFALENSGDIRYRKLLAPEIRHAAALTVAYILLSAEDRDKHVTQALQIEELFAIHKALDPDDVYNRLLIGKDLEKLLAEKMPLRFPVGSLPTAMRTDALRNVVLAYQNAHEAMRAAVATCNTELGNLEGACLSLDDLDTYFLTEEHRAAHAHAYDEFSRSRRLTFTPHEEAFHAFCEREDTYRDYVQCYYGQREWFAFQRNFHGEQNSSMIDIVAILLQKLIIIHGPTNDIIYHTQSCFPEAVHVQYNGHNHFATMAIQGSVNTTHLQESTKLCGASVSIAATEHSVVQKPDTVVRQSAVSDVGAAHVRDHTIQSNTSTSTTAQLSVSAAAAIDSSFFSSSAVAETTCISDDDGAARSKSSIPACSGPATVESAVINSASSESFELANIALISKKSFISNKAIIAKRDELAIRYPGRILEDGLMHLDFSQWIDNTPDEFMRDRECFHSRFQEYFTAWYILQVVILCQVENVSPLDIVKHPGVVEFIKEMILAQPAIQKTLLQDIETTKHKSKTVQTAKVAANAITLLNVIGMNFSNMDFSDISIPNAQMPQALCYGTNFQNADLAGVNFVEAVLTKADFRRANMTGVAFLEQPFICLEDNGNACVYSPDAALLAVGCHNGNIYFYSPEYYELREILRKHTSPVQSIDFSADGVRLASGDRDGTLLVWDIPSKEVKHDLIIPPELCKWPSDVCCVAFSPDTRILASARSDGTVQLWEMTSGTLLRNNRLHSDIIGRIVFSPDGLMLASGSDDNTIKLSSIDTEFVPVVTLESPDYILDIAFSPNGKILAAGSADKTVRLWEMISHQCIKVLKKEYPAWIYSISFSRSGGILAVASDTNIWLWDIDSGMCLSMLDSNDYRQMPPICRVAFSPTIEHQLVSLGKHDKTVRFWDSKSKKIHNTQVNPLLDVRDIVFSASHEIFVLSSECIGYTLYLWNACTLKKIFEKDTAKVGNVVVSATGELLISDIEDSCVRIWDTSTGKIKNVFTGNGYPIHNCLCLKNLQ